MNDWMEGALRTLIDEKAKYVFSLIRGGNIKAVLAQCRNEVGSHVEAIDGRGWVHVKERDEYSPFGEMDYMVFTASGNGMIAQLAVSSTDDKIYTTGYILEKDGWYEWEEYNVELLANCSDDKRKRTSSFEQALEEARQRTKKRHSTATGDRGNKYPSMEAVANGSLKNNSEKAVVNAEIKDNVSEGIGMTIYPEEARSTERNRCIAIPGLSRLEELKDKIIAIKSEMCFIRAGKSAPIELTITNVGSAFIKFTEPTKGYLSNAGTNIYFVAYDGSDFVYCGRLSK